MRRNGAGKYVVSTLYASKAGRNFVIMPHTNVYDINSLQAFIEKQIRERSFPLVVEPAVMSHDGWGYMQHTIDQGQKAAQIAAAFFSPDPIYKSAEACFDAITEQFFLLPIDPDLKVEIGEAMDRIGRSRMTPNMDRMRANGHFCEGASDPDASVEFLKFAATQCPEQVLSNPTLDLYSLTDPAAWNEIVGKAVPTLMNRFRTDAVQALPSPLTQSFPPILRHMATTMQRAGFRSYAAKLRQFAEYVERYWTKGAEWGLYTDLDRIRIQSRDPKPDWPTIDAHLYAALRDAGGQNVHPLIAPYLPGAPKKKLRRNGGGW